MLRSAASTVVRSALSSIRAEECLSSRAVSATLRVWCSTDFAVCFTAASVDFGAAVPAMTDNVRRRLKFAGAMSAPAGMIGRGHNAHPDHAHRLPIAADGNPAKLRRVACLTWMHLLGCIYLDA